MTTHTIREDSQAFLDKLWDTEAELMAQLTERFNARYNETFDPLETVLFLKACKALAAVDGLSEAEAKRLHQRMISFEVPEMLIKAIDEFDVSLIEGLGEPETVGVPTERLEAIVEIFPPGTRKAMALIAEAIAVAYEDGFSDNERATTLDIADWMGVRAEQVAYFEATVRLEHMLHAHPDPEAARAAFDEQVKAYWSSMNEF